MSSLYYQLKINCNSTQQELVSTILGVIPTKTDPWTFEREASQVTGDGITYLVSFLSGKFEKLAELGIERNDVSIWMLYTYQNQCNLELAPTQLEILGKEGIHLCISCYEVK